MRRIPLLIALLALPLMAVACGGSSSSVLGIDAVRAAPERAAEAKTFKFEFKAKFSSDGSSGGGFFDSLFGSGMTMEGEGSVDLEKARSYLKMNVIVIEVEVIQDGDECYTRSNWFGEKWQRDPYCSESIFEDDGFLFGEEPTAVLERLAEVGDEIEDLGEDTIRGVKARHYRAVMHDPEFEEISPGGVPIDIWIDSEGRPVRFAIEMEFEDEEELFGDEGGKIKVSFEFDFFDWGKPVDITIPSEDEIEDLDFFAGWDDEDWGWDDDDWEWSWDDEEEDSYQTR